MRKMFHAIAALILGVCALAASHSTLEDWHPIAVVAAGPANAFVLDASSVIYEVTGTGARIERARVPLGRPMDLGGALVNGRLRMFATASQLAGDKQLTHCYNIVETETLTGLIPDTKPGFYVGVAMSTNGAVYLANSSTHSINVAVGHNGKLDIRPIAEVTRKGAQLGAVAVDDAGHMVYVTDDNAGTVLSVPITGGAPVIVFEGLRDARALAVDKDGRELLIADALLHKVFRVPLDVAAGSGRRTVATSDYLPIQTLDSPSGLSFASERRVWVADEAAHSLRLIDPRGTVLLSVK